MSINGNKSTSLASKPRSRGNGKDVVSTESFSLTPPEFFTNDARFSAFKELIFRMFNWKWHCDPRWGPMEANQLSRLLGEMPDLETGEFAVALRNVAHSEDIPERQRPGFWLPKIDGYIVHHHNTFGRNPHAQIESASSQRARRSSAALAEARKNHRTLTDSTGDLPAAGTDVRRNHTLGAGFKRLSDGRD